MNMWWKWLLSLFVAIPLAAYVAGSLAAVNVQPRPRPPIVIDVNQASPIGSTDSASPRSSDGRDDHRGPGPQTVRPEPDDLDDPDDNLGREDDGGSVNSGPGSVNSGPGSVDSGDGAGATDGATLNDGPTHQPSPTKDPTATATHDAGDDKGGDRPDETTSPSPSPSPSPTATSTATPDDSGSSGSGGGDPSLEDSSGGDPVVSN